MVVFSAGIYIGLSMVLYDNFAEQVQQDAMLAKAAVQFTGTIPSLDAETTAGFQDHERFIRLKTPDGRMVVDTSDPVDILPAIDGHGTAASLQLHQIRGEIYGIVTIPLLVSGRPAGVLQVGESRSDVDEILRLIGLSFALALPLLVCVALIGGYIIAGRALAPVDAITYMAANIRPDDLGSRLELDLPDDELGRLVRTFNAMLARIDRAFARQRQFTGDAAHELRTPLSLIRGQVDLTLSRTRSVAEYEAALGQIRDDVDRLAVVTSTLLTLARADAGALPISYVPFDLGAVATQVIAAYTPEAERRQITILDQTSSAWTNADEDLIVQLLVNLMDNALMHTPPRGVVSVGVDAALDQTCLWVEDSGSGIAAEHLEHIFERFYRADPGRSRAQGGAGLGLAFCRAIARAHGSDIVVESDVGRGTRFSLCLPSCVHDPQPFV
jgi:heavy metal sensor kinase